MSEALNQTFGNEQVQGISETVDTQSSEYLKARQEFFDNMDKDIIKEEPKKEETQTIGKEEKQDGLQEEMSISKTEEISEQEEETSNEEESTDEKVDDTEKPIVKTRQKRQYKVRANGQDFDFTIDDLKLMASKGVNYTQKLQKLAPFRKMLSAIEDNGINEEEINQFIEMRKGNKEAIGAFTKKYNISLSDIEEGEKVENYKPQEYGKEPTALNDIDQELSLSMDSRNYQKMCNFFNKELDNDSIKFFVDNPEALRQLSADIESGDFDNIRREIQKGEMLDKYKSGVSFMQKYIYEARLLNETTKEEEKQTIQEEKPEIDKTKLGITGTKNIADNTKKVINSIDEIDDEEYIAWKKKLMI